MKSYDLSQTNEKKSGHVPAKLLPQYAGGLSASIAAFSLGNILAWTSPASPHIRNGEMNFPVSENEIAWIGGLMPLGCAVSCIPAGYCTDYFGRKKTLLALVPIFALSWGLTIWAQSLTMLYVGRFISGIVGGAVCVVAPTFAAEICQKEIRGILGTFYQLLLASGIMFTYIIGGFLNVFWLSVVCGLFPFLFGATFIFFPDTPVYFLTKGQPDMARDALKFYRGEEYDIESELCELAAGCNKKSDEDVTFLQAFGTKEAIRSTVISIGLMIFQQLSGVNSIIFYTVDIFRDAGSTLDPSYATILIGFMEVISTLGVTFVIDRFGRRILLILSAVVMAFCTLAIGIFFNLKSHHHDISHLGWLPLTSLCLFIIVFSIGYGPIPWAMMPEILPSKIKGTALSIACVVNWLCCFLVTKFFQNLVNALGSDFTFWIFAIISAVGTVFSLYLPETKGKTFEQIQIELAGKAVIVNNNVTVVVTDAQSHL